MGADLAYVGSPFIATEEANAVADYKQMIVEGGADDIVTSSIFTGGVERRTSGASDHSSDFDLTTCRKPRPT